VDLRHLAFAVATLQSRGIRVEDVRIDELTGKRFTFFADPDGLPLELCEERGGEDFVGVLNGRGVERLGTSASTKF
jgi:hypothetical protein